MGRFFRALFKLTLRVLLAVVILCLVLVPALWLGRDSLPPRLAAWGINYVLGALVIQDLAFQISDLGLDGAAIEGFALNGPDGPKADRISATYGWRELLGAGVLRSVRIEGPQISAQVAADGAVSITGLEALMDAITGARETDGAPTDLPPIEISDARIDLSGAVEGWVSASGTVKGTTAQQEIALSGQADLSSPAAAAVFSGRTVLSAQLGPTAGKIGLVILGGSLTALDGQIAIGSGLDGAIQVNWQPDAPTVLSGSAKARDLTIASHRFAAPRLEARLDGQTISATAAANLLDADGAPIQDGAIDLALVVEPADTLRGEDPTRRSVQLRLAAPMAPLERLAAGAVSRPSLGIEGRVSLGLSGSMSGMSDGMLPDGLDSLLAGLVASGGIELSAQGADPAASTLSGRLALAAAAGVVSVETAEPFELTVPIDRIAADPDLSAVLGDHLSDLREVFGPAVTLGFGTERDEFGITFETAADARTVTLSGPMMLSGTGEDGATLGAEITVAVDPGADGGPRLIGPVSITVTGDRISAGGVTLSDLRATVQGTQEGDAFTGSYLVELSGDAPPNGVRGTALKLGGALHLDPDLITVDLADGGSIAARRLELGRSLRPVESLVATLPKRETPPLLKWVRDPEAPGGSRTGLEMHLRPGPFRLDARADGQGSAVDVDAGRLIVTADLDGTGTGKARLRLSNGAVGLIGQGINARGLAADLRLVLTEGAARLASLTVAAERLVDESTEITRFVPMSLQADARPAPARGASDRLRFTATLRGVSGAFVVDAAGHHDPGSGQGRAEVTLFPLQFTPGGLQPADISPAASSFFRETTGSVAASGAIRWPSAPGAVEQTPFTLSLSELSFSGSLGQMLGLDGSVTLSAIDPPATPPGQILQAAILDVGVPIESPQVRFQLMPDGRLVLERVDAAFAGGRVWAEALEVPLDSETPVEMKLNVELVDAATLVELIKMDGLVATGTLSGTIPLVWDPAKGLSVKQASLLADGNGGFIRYRPVETPAALQGAGEEVSLMLEALKNLDYQRFSISADGRPGDTFQVKLNINGSNPDLYDGHPVDLNVTLSGKLDELFRDVQRVLGITDEVQKQLLDGGRGDGTGG